MNSIAEVESAAASLLEALRTLPLNSEQSQIRDFLFPDGMTLVVQLEEDGRKKRSSAAAWNWNPKSGEIRIFLEPATGSTVISEPEISAPPLAVKEQPPVANLSANAQSTLIDKDAVTPDEVIQCCQALDSAEKSNRQFIALKWFRDIFLPTVDFVWARSSHRRQRVLSQAIDMGRIQAKKIANPKSTFPTMTVTLDRTMPIPGIGSRFQPIIVRGEPVSTTLLRDRGSI